MAAMHKLFHLATSSNHNEQGPNHHFFGLAHRSHSSKSDAICEGLVEVKGLELSSWKWLWVEFHEEPGEPGTLALFGPGYKLSPIGSSERFIESLSIHYAERVTDKDCCISLQTANRSRKLYLKFSAEWDLYHWLEEIYSRCPSTGVVHYDTFQHNLHIRQDERRGSLTGFPSSLTRYFEESLNGSDASIPSPDLNKLQKSAQSSLDSELIITPDGTLLDDDINILVEDDFGIRRVQYPEDHISYNPVSPVEPGRSSASRLPKRGTTPPVSTLLPGISRWKHIRDLTADIRRLDTYPAASGGFSDIYKGLMDDDSEEERLVGIKAIRSMMPSRGMEKRLTKRLTSEIDVWQRLHHANVVELLGICQGFGEHPALVSWWYENGHVMDYLESLGDEATLFLRLKLLLDMAKGLSYLHAFDSPVLHGDLKGANILVDKDGNAMLTDFGLSTIFETLVNSGHLSNSGSLGCSIRWMAVELVCSMGDDTSLQRITPATDIYSFGSTMLEVLTGRVPYHHLHRDAQVIMDIFNGLRHQRCETDISFDLWGIMENCWMDIPAQRLTCSTLVRKLEHRVESEWRVENRRNLLA